MFMGHTDLELCSVDLNSLKWAYFMPINIEKGTTASYLISSRFDSMGKVTVFVLISLTITPFHW